MPMIFDSILEVSEVNEYVSQLLKSDPVLKSVRVKGEISGFKTYAASGHWYFSLKDGNAKIDCAMFRTYNNRVSFRPKDGMKVVISGYVDLFVRDGRFQMIVNNMKPDGIGDLYQQFEELKARLYSEGLFDASRKKQLPFLPRKIAVITSASGAVYHDIRNVCFHRNPAVPIVLIPSSVQGDGAEKELVRGVQIAESLPEVDVIIIGRGGGSMEDLWCFNSEILARTIAACSIPVISAVGHETDFTMCDFVSDVRASTPSNAAEIAVPTTEELLDRINGFVREMTVIQQNRIKNQLLLLLKKRNELDKQKSSEKILQYKNHCLETESKLRNAMTKRVEDQKQKLLFISNRFQFDIDKLCLKTRSDLQNRKDKFEALSPYNVLQRGYAIVSNPDGHIVTNVEETKEEQRFNIRFIDGTITVRKE